MNDSRRSILICLHSIFRFSRTQKYYQDCSFARDLEDCPPLFSVAFSSVTYVSAWEHDFNPNRRPWCCHNKLARNFHWRRRRDFDRRHSESGKVQTNGGSSNHTNRLVNITQNVLLLSFFTVHNLSCIFLLSFSVIFHSLSSCISTFIFC